MGRGGQNDRRELRSQEHEELGWIRAEAVRARDGGRPTVRFRLNPRLPAGRHGHSRRVRRRPRAPDVAPGVTARLGFCQFCRFLAGLMIGGRTLVFNAARKALTTVLTPLLPLPYFPVTIRRPQPRQILCVSEPRSSCCPRGAAAPTALERSAVGDTWAGSPFPTPLAHFHRATGQTHRLRRGGQDGVAEGLPNHVRVA